MNNENQPSEEEIRRAYEEDPEDIENIIKFLDYLIASNNFVKVIQIAQISFNHQNQNVPIFQKYAYALDIVGRKQEAQDIMKKCIQLQPNSKLCYFAYITFLSQNGRVQEVQQLYNKLLQFCKDEEVFLNYSIFLQDMGKLQQSEHLLKQLVETHNMSYQGHINYANILCKVEDIQNAQIMYKRVIEINDIQPLGYLCLSSFLQNQNKIEQAIEYVSQLIQKNPPYPQGYWAMGCLLYKTQKFQQASGYFLKGYELDPNLLGSFKVYEYYSSFSQTLFRLGRYEEYISRIQSLINFAPQDELFLQLYCECLLKAGNYEKAEEMLRKLLTLNQSNLRYIELYLQSLKNVEFSKQLSQKIMNTETDNPKVFSCIGAAVIMLKKFQFLEKFWLEKVINLGERTVKSLSFYGKILTELKKYQKAQKFYQEALKMDPDNEETLKQYGTLLSKLRKRKQEEEAYKKCLSINPKNKTVLGNLGTLKKETGDLQQAEMYLQKGVQLDQNDDFILGQYASVLSMKNKNQQAQRYFKRALQINPNSIENMNGYGSFLFTKTNQLDEAQSLLKKLQEITPDQPQPYTNMGIMMRDRKNQYDDAEKYLLKGRDLSSNKIYSNMQLMMLYFKMGKKKNAVEYFQKTKSSFQESDKQVLLNHYMMDNIKFIQVALDYCSPVYNEFKRVQKSQRFLEAEEQDKQEFNQLQDQFIGYFEESIEESQKTGCSQQQEYIKNLQKKLQDMNKKLENFEKRLNDVEGELKRIKKQLMWDQEFSDVLKSLKFIGMKRSESYGRNLCWMICTSIHSYRQVKMGVVGKGNVTHSKVGNYSGKVSKILSKGSSIPFIGKICKLISTVAGLYINQEEQFVVQKIVNCTSQYYSQQQLTKAIIQSIMILLSDKEHLQILQKQYTEESAWYKKYIQKFNEKKQELVKELSGFQSCENDDKQALLDCSYIILNLLKLEDIQTQNPFSDCAKFMLKQKKEKEKQKQKEQEQKKKIQQNSNIEINLNNNNNNSKRKQIQPDVEGYKCVCALM